MFFLLSKFLNWFVYPLSLLLLVSLDVQPARIAPLASAAPPKSRLRRDALMGKPPKGCTEPRSRRKWTVAKLWRTMEFVGAKAR